MSKATNSWSFFFFFFFFFFQNLFKSVSGRLLITTSLFIKFQAALALIVFEIFCWQDCIHIFFFFFFFFSKSQNSEKGHYPVEKKISVSYLFMRNPYKKFQNSSMQVFIKKIVTNWRTKERQEEICPSNIFCVWGIKTRCLNLSGCIMKACLFKYTENFTTKNWIFSDKKIWYFS